MKIRNVLIITLIMAALLLAGCTNGTNNANNGNSNTGSTKKFITGTDGLTITFLDGAPPAETYDGGGNNFGVSVRVENAGMTKVPADKAKLTVTGFRPEDFNVQPGDLQKPLNTDLNGKDLDPQGNELVGGTDIVDFGSTFDYKGTLNGNTPFPLKVSLCYQYATRASSSLCVKKDLLDPTYDKSKGAICDASNQNLGVDVSASPMTITDVKENVQGGNKVSFSFTVKKAKDGTEIYKSFPDQLCNDDTANKDSVFVDVNTGLSDAGETLSCTGLDGTNEAGHDSGDLKLFSGSRLVNCVQDLPAGSLGDFTKEIKITLNYDVRQYTPEKTILVRHINKQN